MNNINLKMKPFASSMPYRIMIYAVALFFLSGVCHSQEKLVFHEIKTDEKGHIVPWFDQNRGRSFDHIINLVWNFWDTMRTDMNGLPYYMNHQVWEEHFNDRRGIGGDQLQMALSSWQLLYQYSGNERVKGNMCFMADYYLSHGLSPSDSEWPDIPYPYNTLIYSGIYDGDMVIGKYFTQPDKAGSFSHELVRLYKMTGLQVYLDAAIKIANTLSSHTVAGDSLNSPMPFKVNALTGDVGRLTRSLTDMTPLASSTYTSNWSPSLNLFLDLIGLGKGRVEDYRKSFDIILNWMKNYPLKNNKWGPFFEDVPAWSDTQINAMTFARFIMEHREYFPSWKEDIKRVFDWVYGRLGNRTWEKYGVVVINEQTAYEVQGNSHTARQGADELLYTSLTGDSSRYENAIRQLVWSTYMVGDDGRNSHPNGEIWMTDGYGDYLRHYLRAMAVDPELATSENDHMVFSSSVIQQVDYHGQNEKKIWDLNDAAPGIRPRIRYLTFDDSGYEIIRMTTKPAAVHLEGKPLSNTKTGEGFLWEALQEGGVLRITRLNGRQVIIYY
jgi:hypothetical protein